MIERTEGIRVLDEVFYFLPRPLRYLFRLNGVYDKILAGTIRDSGDLYDELPKWMLRFQDADYSQLADALSEMVDARGTIVQVGCGRGDLLMRLANHVSGRIVGIDRCPGMVKAARRRINQFPNVTVVTQRVGNYNFAEAAPVSAVIMNNFWGILSPAESKELLIKIHDVLIPTGRVVIGKCGLSDGSNDLSESQKRAAEELGFYLAYPRFMDFDSCGFLQQVVSMDGGYYFILTKK